jgi:hypothetical protein
VTASVAAKRDDMVAWTSAGLQRLRGGIPALRYCAGVYLVVRIALFLLSAAAWGLTNEQTSVTTTGRPGVLTNGWHNAITGWNRQDSLWFLEIAQHGYSSHNGSAAFYPGYPILIRVVGYLCFGHLLLAAYLVSNIALLAALLVLYRLTEREYDLAAARRAVLYLCLFPTAFFLFDTYSESVFLLATVGAFALARGGRWGWASLAGLGAALTRSMGVVVALALAAEAVHQMVEDHRLRDGDSQSGRGGLVTRGAIRLGASAVPLLGTGGYLLFWQLRDHDWARPIQLEKAMWGRQFGAPWLTLWHGLTMAWRYGPVGGAGWWMLDLVLVAGGLVLGLWVAVKARPIYAVYTWGSLLLMLSAGWPGRPLVSDPRYLVTIFPLVWPLALLGRKQGAHDSVVGLSAASMAIVAWLFVTTPLVF